VENSSSPSGRLVKSWQAENVPTLAVRGQCGDEPCMDQNPKCTEWAANNQCILNPGYMRSNCQKSCGTCPEGNFSGFSFDAASGKLRLGDFCLDSEGQLPGAVNVQNVMHVLPCETDKHSQKWNFNGTSGQLRSEATGSCLATIHHWLWDYVDIPTLAGCSSDRAIWTLHANTTLSNKASGCVEVSSNFGPPSTVWTKPLTQGRQAVLAINAADMSQRIDLDFSEFAIGASTWHARSIWDNISLGTKSGISAVLGPHDSILLVLSPNSATKASLSV